MSAHFEIKQTVRGDYYFVLKGCDGNNLLSSRLYAAKASAQRGIRYVRANISADQRFLRFTPSNQPPCFHLKTCYGETVAQSIRYPSPQTMEEDIRLVKALVPSAETVDLTHTSARSLALRDH